MTEDIEINAAESRQLLNNPMFQRCWDEATDSILTQIEVCPIEDSAQRNQLGLMLASLSLVKQLIQGFIDTAILAENENIEQ